MVTSTPPQPPKSFRPAWPPLRLAIQAAFAAIVTYAVATALALPQSYWAVITAILVVQASIGASLGNAIDRLIATMLGAVSGAALVTVFGTSFQVTFATVFAAVTLLTYWASRRASLRLAPVTAIIVILGDPGHGEPVAAAVNRVVEIGLGTIIALAASLLIFPSRAGHALAAHMGKTLPLLARHLAGTIDGALGPPRDEAAMLALNNQVYTALAAGDTLAAEARREITGHLAGHADPAAVLRTLRRLWHTELMAARAAARSVLPAAAAERLRQPLLDLRAAALVFSERLAQAYATGASPPDLAPVDAALTAFENAITGLRRSGAARGMTDDEVARLFAFAFALEQLPQNFKDLAGRCHDLRPGSRSPGDSPN